MARVRHLALRRRIIAGCREMNRLGLNQGTSGNISARVPEGFLITPSGVPYDDLSPRLIVAMDLDGGHRGRIAPSSEWRMHRDIYAAHDDAGAVVHLHPTYCTALAALRLEIPRFHYMIAVAGGDSIRCAGYATFGTRDLSAQMLRALKGRKACLLANHGMIGFERDLERALRLAVEVEALARQYWAARQIGEPALLSRAEIKRVLAKFANYGQASPEAAS